MRRVAAFGQSGASFVLEASDPLVAGPAADPIVGAELGHGVGCAQMNRQMKRSRCCMDVVSNQGIISPFRVALDVRSVTRHPGYSVTNLAGLYRLTSGCS